MPDFTQVLYPSTYLGAFGSPLAARRREFGGPIYDHHWSIPGRLAATKWRITSRPHTGVSENVVDPKKIYGPLGGEMICSTFTFTGFHSANMFGLTKVDRLDMSKAGSLSPQDVAGCRACWRRRRWKGRWAQRSSGNTCREELQKVSVVQTWFRHGEWDAVLRMVNRSDDDLVDLPRSEPGMK